MRYRLVTTAIMSALFSLGVFSTTDTVFAASNPNTTISAPRTKAEPAKPLPNWIKKRIADGESCPEWEPLFREFGLPVKYFSYIAFRESRCRKSAINAIWKNGKIVWTLNKNGTFDSGLLQINSGWRTVTKQVCGGDISKLMNPRCNVAVARFLYDDGGLRHWSIR